ncbi:hypothetical protein P692DRAFT_20347368 [Suillus brevipes Sb2]|nr:hypothetical protein P692DRAFT_20347368 [Suillus brevipes Sb2]
MVSFSLGPKKSQPSITFCFLWVRSTLAIQGQSFGQSITHLVSSTSVVTIICCLAHSILFRLFSNHTCPLNHANVEPLTASVFTGTFHHFVTS